MLVGAMMLANVAPASHAWATFSRGSSQQGVVETAEIETLGSDRATHQLRFGVRLTWRRSGKVTAVQYADSNACPAVMRMVRGMRLLPVPQIAPPGLGIDDKIVLDGTTYSFEGPATGSNGHVAFSSNTDTPLATWVDAQLAALAPCWKPAKS